MNETYALHDIAELLEDNSYPGRGIIIGETADGKKAVTAYFIMGRSENSRNRVFEETGEDLIIYPADESKVEDPSLIIYKPIRRFENRLIVTNGDQTDTIYEFLKEGKSFGEALTTREFEPDAPNYTPRISGMLTFFEEKGEKFFRYKLSILKSADEKGSACNRFTYSYSPLRGTGHFIHTYKCDGNPIPTFEGEPERITVDDDMETFAKKIWSALNSDNKISLYVRYIDIETGECENLLFNKYTRK